MIFLEPAQWEYVKLQFCNGDEMSMEMPVEHQVQRDLLILAASESAEAVVTGFRIGGGRVHHSVADIVIKPGNSLVPVGSFSPRCQVELHCLQRRW